MDVVSPLAKHRKKPIDRIRLAWPAICGTELAHCTQPIAVRAGCLHIEAIDAHWLSVLETLGDGVIREVRQLNPGIETLDIRVAAQLKRSPRLPNKTTSETLPPVPDTDLNGSLDDFVSAWERSGRRNSIHEAEEED